MSWIKPVSTGSTSESEPFWCLVSVTTIVVLSDFHQDRTRWFGTVIFLTASSGYDRGKTMETKVSKWLSSYMWTPSNLVSSLLIWALQPTFSTARIYTHSASVHGASPWCQMLHYNVGDRAKDKPGTVLASTKFTLGGLLFPFKSYPVFTGFRTWETLEIVSELAEEF